MFKSIQQPCLRFLSHLIRNYCSKTCDSSGQLYDTILENAMNKQINRELTASHYYFSLGQHFFQTKVCRYGFGEFFLNQSRDEQNHARVLCKYQCKRGGIVLIYCIDEPKHSKNMTPVDAVKTSLETEIEMYNCLNELHNIAGECNDIDAMEFISDTLIKDQVEEIHQLNILLTKLGQVNNDIGLYLIDRELQKMSPRRGDVSH